MRGSSGRERSAANGLYREGQRERRVAQVPRKRERGKRRGTGIREEREARHQRDNYISWLLDGQLEEKFEIFKLKLLK